jgi:thioesterase domain-containing protein
MSHATELAEYVRGHLPLATAMAVSVVHADECRVQLDFPLGPNLNHEQTAFGGSLAAAGMLAAWGLIWIRARHLSPTPRLVIAESQMRFIRPVDRDFRAAASWPDEKVWPHVLSLIEKRGRSRVELRTELSVGGRVAAVHDGTFVVALPAG